MPAQPPPGAPPELAAILAGVDDHGERETIVRAYHELTESLPGSGLGQAAALFAAILRSHERRLGQVTSGTLKSNGALPRSLPDAVEELTQAVGAGKDQILAATGKFADAQSTVAKMDIGARALEALNSEAKQRLASATGALERAQLQFIAQVSLDKVRADQAATSRALVLVAVAIGALLIGMLLGPQFAKHWP